MRIKGAWNLGAMGVEQLLPLGEIAFNTDGAAAGVKLGTLPKGLLVTGFMTRVTEAFNAGTTNVVTLGIENDLDAYLDGDDTAAGTAGVKVAATAALPFVVGDEDVDVYAAFTQTGTAATAGCAEFYAKVINIG